MGLLDVVIIVLVIVWLGGTILKIGGTIIHLLLVIALVILVARLLGVNM